MMTQKKQSKKEVCANFARTHKVGSKVHGMKIFDIARNNEGEIFVILPLYDFAKHINVLGEQCLADSQKSKKE